MNREPDFINPEGVKWWKGKTLTEYAREHLSQEHSVWRVEQVNGKKTLLLLKGQDIIAEEHQGLEGMAYKIDAIRLSREQ